MSPTPAVRSVRPSRRTTPRVRRLAWWAPGGRAAVAAGVVAVAAGCSLPALDDPATRADPDEAPVGAVTPDPARDALVAQLDELTATVAVARDALADAASADQASAVRTAAATAAGALVAGDGPPPTTRPLFPASAGDRDQVGRDDQLARTLTAASDAGRLGNEVADLLRDPIAGDLGSWQRDPAGVLALVDAVVEAGGDLEQLDVAVNELPGLGTRAVAWTRLVDRATSVGEANAYAERGSATLDVVLGTLERVDVAGER